MPATRLLVAALALALIGLVPSGTTSAAAAEREPVTSKIVKRSGKLFLTGVVRPRRGPVVVERATSCNRRRGTCNFTDYRTTKVNQKGRYTVRVYAPRSGAWAWRATRGKDVSPVWLTCVKKPAADCPIP